MANRIAETKPVKMAPAYMGKVDINIMLNIPLIKIKNSELARDLRRFLSGMRYFLSVTGAIKNATVKQSIMVGIII